MKTTKRILSSILALVMLFSLCSTGFSVSAVESNGAILDEIVLEPIARPDVTFTVTPVTRVALAANSLEPGNQIVKATPSGVPELSGSYAAQAYAGETPIATKIEFQSNTVGVTPKGITCSNESVVLSDLNYNGSTGTYSCEIISGTAEAGSAITFTIDYEWTDGNSYQEKCVTFVEKIANGGSYVEAQSEIQALSGTGSYYRLWASASTRLLGNGVYYEQPAEIVTSTSDPFRSYGIYNVATGTMTENVAAGYNTSLFADDKTDKPAGKHNQANEFTVPGTTLAHVYVDSSVTKTLADANIRLDANVGALSDRNNSNPYTALADAWVSAGSNVDTIVTTNDAAAQAAIGFAIPAKADYGVTQFQQNASMTTLTAGVGQYGNIFTQVLTGNVANLVDGSSYTITTKYYSYMWVKKGALQHYNMTSAATVPTSITFHIVDKGPLRDLIDMVMNSDPTTPSTRTQQKGANPQGWFYRSGFSQFQTAYVEALRVLNNPKATQSEIDAATKSLQTMYNNLQLKTADYTKADELKKAAEAIVKNSKAYRAEDIALINEALDGYEKSYSILYQGAVDTMAKNLDTAIKNAKPLPADYSKVDEAKTKANKLSKDDYTTDSWNNLQSAINAVVYGKSALEQTEVDAMAAAINTAIANLKPVTADLSALIAKLDEAKAIDRNNYINGSLLITPIDTAQNLINENAVTPIHKERQPEIDAAVKALDDTIKGLIARSAYKDALKAAIDAEIPGVIEYYDQAILAQYDKLVAEGIALYNDSTLTVLQQGVIDTKTKEITDKYAELMASYDDSCRHNFVDEPVIEKEVAATCTTAGSYDEVVYCADCGAEVSRKTNTVAALGHKPAAAVEENRVEATPTVDGSYDMVVYCSVCGEELSRETSVIPALGHESAEAVEENRVEATCTTDGSYDVVVYCTCCTPAVELSRETKTIEALGHTDAEAVEENRKEADCVTAGSYDMVVYCSVCGEEVSRETFEIKALGHTAAEAVEENRVEATYESAGSYDSVVYCSVCGEELSRDTNEIPMLDGYFKAAEGSTTVIDKELGFIYGLDIGLSDLEGYVEYSKSVSYETPDGIGTGMVVTTYRSGEEWETYTLIIFGDLNGDGVIDIYDASILAAIVNGDMELEEGDAILFAADLNGDTVADIYDLAILNSVVNGETEIGQVPLA